MLLEAADFQRVLDDQSAAFVSPCHESVECHFDVTGTGNLFGQHQTVFNGESRARSQLGGSWVGVPCIDPIEAGVTALQDASVARREARAPFGNQVYLDKQFVGEFSFLYRLNQMLRDKS